MTAALVFAPMQGQLAFAQTSPRVNVIANTVSGPLPVILPPKPGHPEALIPIPFGHGATANPSGKQVSPRLPWTGAPPAYRAVRVEKGTSPEAAAALQASKLPVKLGDLSGVARGPVTPKVLASNTVQGPASIVELARSLKNDPLLIYEFVYNNIDYYPIYGVQKGALGALLDGKGTAFDQAELMVALERQAGFTADYEYGQIALTAAQVANWFGVDSTNSAIIDFLLSQGGFPHTTVSNANGSVQTVYMNHLWVKVIINGVATYFDPSYKTYTYTTPTVPVATAMGYSQSSFLSGAQSGATITAQYINGANPATQLQTLSMNLVNWIKTNNPTATMDSVLGGKQIATNPNPNGWTTYPLQSSGSTVEETTGTLIGFEPTLEIQFAGIDYTATSDQVYGHRLMIFWNDPNWLGKPELTLDGTVLAYGNQEPNQFTPITFIVTHTAYPDTHADGTSSSAIYTGVNTLIGNSWGPTGRGMVSYHQQTLNQNLFTSGNSVDSEPLIGESLSVLYHTWAAENSAVGDILDRMGNNDYLSHHKIAVLSSPDTSGALMGVQQDVFEYVTRATSTATELVDNLVYQMHGGLQEGSAIAQVTGVKGIAAPQVLGFASTQSQNIYIGNSADWTSVQSSLTGYSPATLSAFTSAYINTGANLILPANGSTNIDHWTGYGVQVFGNSGASGQDLLGTLQGGELPDFQSQEDFNHEAGHNQDDPGLGETPDTEDGDPVDMFTGNYTSHHTDLTVGSQKFPYGLSFERQYNSGQRLVSGPLGLGWNHNWGYSVAVNSDGFQGFGQRSPISAAAGIAELYVSQDILNTGGTAPPPFANSLIASLSNSWLAGQTTNNTVVISGPNLYLEFVKLPDGSYNPPVGCANVLVLNGDGTYTMVTPQKQKMNFNSTGQIATWSFPTGVTIIFSYNANGQLQTVSNGVPSLSQVWHTLTLNYTGSVLTSVSDGTGRSVTYTVDGSSDLASFKDANGQTWQYAYDQPGRLTTIYRPANPGNAFITNVYDSLSRVKTQSNAEGEQSSFYIANARSESDDPLGNKHVLYFNSAGLATRDINALGYETDYRKDALGRTTTIILPEGNYRQFTFDASNNLLSSTDVAKAGSGLANVVNTYTYDPNWNTVKTFVDGRSNTWTYSYDPANGNLLSVTGPTVNSQVPTLTFTYNTRGQMLTRVDETGIIAKLTYDTATEELLSAVIDSGSSPHLNITTSLTYDTVGNIKTLTEPNGNLWQIQTDVLRRRTQITAPSPFSYVTQYTYDADNNNTSVQNQTGNTQNPWQTYTYAYSLSDKLKQITDPALNSTVLGFDGKDRYANVTDAASREYQYAYDAIDRVLTVTDPTNVVTETNVYTPNGELSSVKDARGNITTYTPDGYDRTSKITYPDSTYEQLTYDSNSNVLTFRTRSGNSITNTFDVLNRLSTKAPTSEGQVGYTYDLAGRILTISDPVISGDPSTGTFLFGYDTAGRVISEKTPDAKTTQYGFDLADNLIKMTWPDGYYATRKYDQLNRLTDIYLNGSTTSAAHFGYDQLSRRTSLAYQNGASVGYTYQLNDDLTTLVHNFVGSSISQTFGYNNVHQITSRSLSDATYSWHPTAAASTSYGTGSNTNSYPTIGGTAYTYDGNGNLKTDGTWTYTYNTENQQTASSKTGTATSSVIDPLLRQTQKTIGSAKTRFVYSGDTEIADYNGVSGALTNRYIFGDSGNEPVITVTSAGALSYLHSDQAGSVIAQSGSTGAVSNKYTYSPFGESAALAGTTFGYAGQRYDSENGLYYARARHYSPTIGRFLQADPIGYTDGLNWYAYGGNDPLNATDPSGLVEVEITHSIGGNFTGPGGTPDDPGPSGSGDSPVLIPTITQGGDSTEGTADECDSGGVGGGDLVGQRGKSDPVVPDPFKGHIGAFGAGIGNVIHDPLLYLPLPKLSKAIGPITKAIVIASKNNRSYIGRNFVYAITHVKTGQIIKIGQTARTLEIRFRENFNRLKRLGVIPNDHTINDYLPVPWGRWGSTGQAKNHESGLIWDYKNSHGGDRPPGNFADH